MARGREPKGIKCIRGGPQGPFFVCVVVTMDQNSHQISALLRPVIGTMGYELLGVELRGGQSLLRVYIDRPEGITVDDCERVSHQISALLDVEPLLPGTFTLEVSSPGMDRPLFEADHYQRFSGERIRVKLAVPLAGRRNVSGVLRGLREDQVILDTGQGEVAIPLAQIESARLVPDFDRIAMVRGQQHE